MNLYYFADFLPACCLANFLDTASKISSDLKKLMSYCSHCTYYYYYFSKFKPGVDRWQLLTTHTSDSLCEPDMRISIFNCDVHQTLSVINSAAVSLKIINTRLAVFLSTLKSE